MKLYLWLSLFMGVFTIPNLFAIEYKDITTALNDHMVYFTENKGQYNEEVLFFTRSSNGQQFITSSGLTYMLPWETEESRLKREAQNTQPTVMMSPPHHEYYALKIEFENANPAPRFSGINQLPCVHHYLKGRDQSKWITHVRNYEKLRIDEIYSDIDLVYYGNENLLEYDLIVSPGGDPSDISIVINGADSLNINNDGHLEIYTPFGKVIQSMPVTYQNINGEQIEIESAFSVKTYENSISFDIGEYSTEHDLIIDPTYRYSHLYGSANDIMGGVDMDSTGNVYITGRTESTNFPATIGTYQGDYDAFAAKLDGSGTKLWVAYIGGSDEDKGRDVAVGPFDKVYLTGATKSTDFPVAGSYLDDSYNGSGLDAFVMYLSPAGDVVQYSTYLGGIVAHADGIGYEDDRGTSGYAIDVDDAGYFYVAGASNSMSIPGTSGAFDENYYGFTTIPGPSVVYYSDAIVCKFTPTGTFDGSGFLTYLGGSGFDVATGIDIDDSGYIYVSGYTSVATDDPADSTAYPYSTGSYFEYYSMGRSTFVTKLFPEGNELAYSIPYGGCNWENIATGVAVDDNYCAYVTGYTGTFNTGCLTPFPVTALAFDQSFNTSLADDAFVYKVNQDGTDVLWATLIGGEDDDRAYAIDIDETGSPFITGVTYSNDFPKADPGNISIPYIMPPSNLFLAKVSASGSYLDFSGLFGTPFEDYQYGPACAYNNQSVAFSGYFDALGIPAHTDGYVYIFDVSDLHQPMAFNSITLSQPLLIPALQGITHKKILTIEVLMDGVLNPLTATEFALSTNGTANPTTNVTDAKLFYLGSSGILDTNQQFGSTVIGPSGAFNITGNQILRSGINRFILTYDISGTAIIGDSIDAECLSVTIDGLVYTPAITAPRGGAIVADTQSGLTGTGLVGPGGDFADINEALSAITQYGIAGDLILELTPGQHYGQIQLWSKKSTSKANTDQRSAGNIVIQSHGDPNSAELMFFATDSMANYVIQANWPLGDTMFIRNLTITALGSEYASAIELTEGARNFYFENNIINGTTISGGPMKHKALVKTWTWGGYNTNVVFKGNTFNDGTAGIYWEYGLDSNVIDSNTFNNQMMHGVYLYEHFNPYIGKNNFNSSLPNMNHDAIKIIGGYKFVVIEKNRIGTSYGRGIALISSSGEVDSLRALISNNFISLTNNTPVVGIQCAMSHFIDIFHNNVNITSNDTSSACLSTYISTNIRVANNILVNTGGGFAYVDFPAKAGIGTGKIYSPEWSDYNDLYATGSYIGQWDGVDINDLIAFQTATGMEEHSLSVDPGYVSVTDLHTTSLALVGAGIYLDRVPDDIDGNPRDPNNPSIGGGVYVPNGVDDDIPNGNMPEQFVLQQNYPNPFNPSTVIGFSLPKRADVAINIYNILGRKVVSLVNKNFNAGYHSVTWEGNDANGDEVATGIYFFRLKAGNFVETKKMLLLR